MSKVIIKREATAEDLKNLKFYKNVHRKVNTRFSKLIFATDADVDG